MHRLLAQRCAWALVVLVAGSAGAQQPQASPTPATPTGVAVPSTMSPSQPSGPRATPASPAGQSSEMSFDLFGDQTKKSPLDEAREQERIAKLERKVHLRRQLLRWHVALGFVTLAALAATDIIGQLNYQDKFAATGTDAGTFATVHEGLAIGTTGLFAATGILALAAPNPYPKPIKLDAALVHKLAMALATACFVTQVVLGPISAISDGKLYQRDLAVAHLVTGYGAFAFMAAGVLAYVF